METCWEVSSRSSGSWVTPHLHDFACPQTPPCRSLPLVVRDFDFSLFSILFGCPEIWLNYGGNWIFESIESGV